MLIVVGGAVASTAGRGGDTWHRLHWLLGLRRLGAHVHLVEQIAHDLTTRSSDAAQVSVPDPARYFHDVLSSFGLAESATLLTDRREAIAGLPWSDARRLIADADVVINISGHLDLNAWQVRPMRSVFIDEDPGFTQMWHVSGALGDRLEGYDYYYSVGARVGTDRTSLPADGVPWRHLRPFAVLDQWPVMPVAEFDRFTTVAGWRGPFAAIEFEGRRYGSKAHEFRKFTEVPRCARLPFELALDIHPADATDIAMLERTGWRLVDPTSVAATPQAFRTYVQTSGAEFSVAKEMYVASGSGWFSDRTIRYLASGRPAVVQDTGYADDYPVGRGLVTFRTVGEAVEGCRRVTRDYAEHCEAARDIARACFDSDNVLGRFLDEVGVGGS